MSGARSPDSLTAAIRLNRWISGITPRVVARPDVPGHRGLAPRVRVHDGRARAISQAGLTLGLSVVIARNFPGLGEGFRSLAIATVAVNEMAGPVLFCLPDWTCENNPLNGLSLSESGTFCLIGDPPLVCMPPYSSIFGHSGGAGFLDWAKGVERTSTSRTEFG